MKYLLLSAGLLAEFFWPLVLLLALWVLTGCATTRIPVCPEPDLINFFVPNTELEKQTVGRAKSKCFFDYRGQCVRVIEKSKRNGSDHYQVTCGGKPE